MFVSVAYHHYCVCMCIYDGVYTTEYMCRTVDICEVKSLLPWFSEAEQRLSGLRRKLSTPWASWPAHQFSNLPALQLVNPILSFSPFTSFPFFLILLLWGKVLLYNPGWTRTQRNSPASVSWVLGIKVCSTNPNKTCHFHPLCFWLYICVFEMCLHVHMCLHVYEWTYICKRASSINSPSIHFIYWGRSLSPFFLWKKNLFSPGTHYVDQALNSKRSFCLCLPKLH